MREPEIGENIAVPGHLLPTRGGEHYVLRVVGDSMIGEGFRDGDFLIVLRRELAEPGEICVVLVGDESTIKRYFPEGDRVRLESANPSHEPILLPAEDVRVQGIAIGLMRKLR